MFHWQTDDKGIFSTNLSKEFCITAQYFGLSISDIHLLTKKAVDYIFDDCVKTKLHSILDSCINKQ